MRNSDSPWLRLFVLESPNPLDVLQTRAEVHHLKTIGDLLEYEVATYTVFSRREFQEKCKWIASISNDPQIHSKKGKKRRYDAPLCVHISTHGNEKGLVIADEVIQWRDLVEDISPICKEMYEYYGKVIFIISACEAGEQTITNELKKQAKKGSLIDIPIYLFVTADCEVAWQDAAVAWTLFYHQLKEVEFDKKKSIQNVLDKIKISCDISIRYYRWESKQKKYLKWEPQKKIKID